MIGETEPKEGGRRTACADADCVDSCDPCTGPSKNPSDPRFLEKIGYSFECVVSLVEE